MPNADNLNRAPQTEEAPLVDYDIAGPRQPQETPANRQLNPDDQEQAAADVESERAKEKKLGGFKNFVNNKGAGVMAMINWKKIKKLKNDIKKIDDEIEEADKKIKKLKRQISWKILTAILLTVVTGGMGIGVALLRLNELKSLKDDIKKNEEGIKKKEKEKKDKEAQIADLQRVYKIEQAKQIAQQQEQQAIEAQEAA